MEESSFKHLLLPELNEQSGLGAVLRIYTALLNVAKRVG